MERLTLEPRPDWRQKVEAQGLIWHTAGDAPYWTETACYRFSSREITEIESATNELYNLFVQAGDYIVANRLFGRFGIPQWVWPYIAQAWNDEPPALNYGRFDLGYDGKTPPKLFEFNCDTPTSLLEAAVIQWFWREEVFPNNDQFNSLHERLVAKWRDIAPYLRARLVHFTHATEDSGEDAVTVAYLRDTAREAGLDSIQLPIDQIGWNSQQFVDLDNAPIEVLFKLYPWEWLVNEPFGAHIVRAPTQWIEPVWKMIWSNKAILPILWQLFPDHPYLLPASFDPLSGSHVRKPLLSREGANITLVRGDRVIEESAGDYGEEGFVYQAAYALPNFDGHHPVIGSWIVDGEAAGMGIREGGLITDNTARFVPHIIK